MSKCVLGACVQLLKTAGANEKPSWKILRKTLRGGGAFTLIPLVRPRVTLQNLEFRKKGKQQNKFPPQFTTLLFHIFGRQASLTCLRFGYI